MFSSRSVMALLVMVALSAKVAESDMAAPDICSAADVGVGFCFNCKTKAKCMAADIFPTDIGECIPGEACTVMADVATCEPFANTACTCAEQAQCDAYDPDSVLVCLSGGITANTNCATDGKTCVNGACVTPVSTTSTASPAQLCSSAPDGFVVLKPSCTSAVYCSGFTSLGTTDCLSGQYFDMDVMDCLPIPPVPCAGCGTGACPDKSNCSKWYICDEGGSVLSEETCEPLTPDFDIFSHNCETSGAAICTGNDGCTYGLTASATTVATTVVSSSDGSSTGDGGTTGNGGTTGGGSDSTTSAPGSTDDSTTTTSRPAECTADNVGQYYPFEGDCKKYWACRQVGTGQYDYVESICPGELLFNPVTGSCDTEANVVCIPPAAVFF